MSIIRTRAPFPSMAYFISYNTGLPRSSFSMIFTGKMVYYSFFMLLCWRAFVMIPAIFWKFGVQLRPPTADSIIGIRLSRSFLARMNAVGKENRELIRRRGGPHLTSQIYLKNPNKRRKKDPLVIGPYRVLDCSGDQSRLRIQHPDGQEEWVPREDCAECEQTL